MDTLPVTLIIKAPNQLIEDQTIECESTWSVKRLKEHLSDVYPNKPSQNDQKLIYSGHLLNDNVVLKDVLREYGGPKCIHTLHLVCTPKHIQKIPTTPAATRNNIATELTNENSTPPITNNPALNIILNERVPNLNYYNTGHYNNEFMMMQQSYVQYMQHYMNIAHLQQFGVPLPGLSGQYLLHEYNNRLNQSALRYRYNAQGDVAIAGDTDIVGAAEGAAPLNFGGGNVAVPFEQLQQFAPRDQDAPADLEEPIPVPAVQAQQLRGIGMNDDRDHRDWLEHFYMVCRIMIFISIVYFYSSATRFIVVFFTAICLYLYQIGFFRNVNINNNDINANQRRPGEDVVAGGIAGGHAPGVAPAADIDGTDFEYPRPHEREPSRLTVVWTFVTTFLASLLPEIPNVV